MTIQNYWANPIKWPMDFADKVFLLRAVIKIGKAQFGDQWKDDDVTAEPIAMLPSTPPNNKSGQSLGAYFLLKKSRPDLSLSENFMEHSWTQELWNVAVEVVKVENETKKAAALRFTKAKQSTLKLLQAGALQTYTRQKQGGTFSGPLDVSVWNTELWWNRFQWGQIDPIKPFTNAVGGNAFQYIFVDSHGVQKSVDEIRKSNSPIDAFLNTGFPLTDAILKNLKGPKFIPKNCIKLRDALSKVGRAKVQNWSGQETDETSWHDETEKETSSYLRWREAVTWFRHELFEASILASRMEKNGTIVDLAKENFAQDNIEHIFRKHQEDAWIVFVDESKLSKLLSKPTLHFAAQTSALDNLVSDTQNQPDENVKPKLQQAEADKFMKERSARWPAGQRLPTEVQDWAALKENFPNNLVPREVMRKARATIGGAWRTQGPKKARTQKVHSK